MRTRLYAKSLCTELNPTISKNSWNMLYLHYCSLERSCKQTKLYKCSCMHTTKTYKSQSSQRNISRSPISCWYIHSTACAKLCDPVPWPLWLFISCCIIAVIIFLDGRVYVCVCTICFYCYYSLCRQDWGVCCRGAVGLDRPVNLLQMRLTAVIGPGAVQIPVSLH